jgi:hypothetical protein
MSANQLKEALMSPVNKNREIQSHDFMEASEEDHLQLHHHIKRDGGAPAHAELFHSEHSSHHLLIQKTREEFDELKETQTCWVQLPDSVIGTLIYFLLVEHNDARFRVFDNLWCLVIIGFPVYLTYFFQWTILYQLWITLPALGDVVNSGLCTVDLQIELAASSVFFIFIYKNCSTVINESFIVLRCERVAFIEHELEDEINIVKLQSPMAKRLFVWFTVCLAEILLLLGLCVVGTQYM